jgi:hypothetical protein
VAKSAARQSVFSRLFISSSLVLYLGHRRPTLAGHDTNVGELTK